MDHVSCNDKKIQFDLKHNIQPNINKYLKYSDKSGLDTPQVFDFLYIESNVF